MKMFKKTLAAIATVGALTGATSANAYLTNWYLDTDGPGGVPAVEVSEYVDLNGNSYIQSTGGTTYSFNEVGSYVSGYANGSTHLDKELSSSFVGSGTGVGDNFTFTNGTLAVNSGATPIGMFTLVSGSGIFDNDNVPVPNGHVSIVFEAESLAYGYFCRDALCTQDLATEVAGGSVLLGFTTTDATALTSWADSVDTGLTKLWNDNFTHIDHIATVSPNELVIGNNGQFRLVHSEPASLSLVGLGLLGLGALRRREAK